MMRRHVMLGITMLIVVLGTMLPGAAAQAQRSARTGSTLPLCFSGGGLEVTVAASPVTLQNCQVSGLSDPGNAGAIYVDSGATLKLIGVLLTGNTAGSSGGAIFNNGTVNLTTVTATNNTASDGAGGAIFNDGTLTVSGSTFQGNNAGYGGAIFSDGGSTLTVTNSTFGGAASGQGNTSSQSGGGIYANYATASITGTTFTNNTVGYSGGGLELYGGQVSLHSSTFNGNYSGVDAGAIQVGLGTLCNCGAGDPTVKITGNTAANADGGGIENHFGQVTLSNATISGNSSGAGGGIYSKSGAYAFSNSTFSSNAPQNCAPSGIQITNGGGNSDSDGSCGFTSFPTPVAAGTALGQDSFAGRTVSGGWGTASNGVPWVLQSGSAALLSVGNSEGHIIGVPSSAYQFLTLGGTATNEEVVARYSTGSFGDDAGRLLLRFVNANNYYAAGFDSPTGATQLRIIKVTNGTQSSLCSTPFAATNGIFYWERVRVQTSGKNAVLSARAWPAGTAEPTTWQLTCTDTSPLGAGLTGVDGWDGGVSWSLDTYSAGDLGSGTQAKTVSVLPSVSSVRACNLLTNSEVAGLSDAVTRTARERTVSPFASCDYAIKGGAFTLMAATTAMLSQSNGLTAAQMYARIASTLPGPVQHVSNLGTNAVWASGTHQLWVLKGNLLFSLSSFQPGNGTLDLLEKAARKVLARA